MDQPILNWELDNSRLPLAAAATDPFIEHISPASAATVFHQLEASPLRIMLQLPESGWTMFADNVLHHPAQGMLSPLARAMHMDEIIFIYPHRFFSVLRKDNSYTIARLA
jgi:hypothetical protein